MLRILKKSVIAVVTGCLFIITTLMGWIAASAGAFVRAQIPALDDLAAASQDTPSTATTAAPDAGKRLPSKEAR